MTSTIGLDPKRILLSYLFFGLGVALTFWQYHYLLFHSEPLPVIRQSLLIVVNTLAVWVGALLAYPWGVGEPEAARPAHYFRHYNWIKWVSLIFCFASMLGIAISLLQWKSTDVPFGAYFVACVYMIGYGLLGIGPDVVRWSVNRIGTSVKEEPKPVAPSPVKKRRIYPIASEFVIGRIRRPASPTDRGKQDD